MAAHAQAAPLLILTQARPELLDKRPAWGRRVSAFTLLPLAPLSERAGEELIAVLCCQRGIPVEVAAAAGRGAGGNPLLAEELVATLGERDGRANGTEGIPSLIKALISARLDSLPPEPRRAVQLASVFGKGFWAGGVRALGALGDLTASLALLEQKDLLRAQPASQLRGEQEYRFKHDLIRDVAYETLPRAERRRLHGRAADWIEQAVGEQAEEYLDLLAHHVARADQPARSLVCLARAAERARRAAAHRQELALLAQAIAIAEQLGREEYVTDLRAKRGRAFASLALWRDARPELEAALAALAPKPTERRAELLVELARVCHWALDGPSLWRYGKHALATAEAVQRADLATEAMGWLALAHRMEGDVPAALKAFERTVARRRELHLALSSHTPSFYCVTLYWTGQAEAAVEHGRDGVRIARQGRDAGATVHAHSALGLGLAGCGRYEEALQVLAEGQAFGREHDVIAWVATCLSMESGVHISLFDYDGAVALAEEARELARSVRSGPPLVSAGLDLLFSSIRGGEAGGAQKLVEETAVAVETELGSHRWLWQLRLSEARAELALARGEWEEARRWAETAMAQSSDKGRVKYHVAGLESRARALAALGRKHQAIADLRAAVTLALPTGDPAMFLRAATALLEIEGDGTLAAETRAAALRIATSLPEGELRRRFEASEPVRRLGELSR